MVIELLGCGSKAHNRKFIDAARSCLFIAKTIIAMLCKNSRISGSFHDWRQESQISRPDWWLRKCWFVRELIVFPKVIVSEAARKLEYRIDGIPLKAQSWPPDFRSLEEIRQKLFCYDAVVGGKAITIMYPTISKAWLKIINCLNKAVKMQGVFKRDARLSKRSNGYACPSGIFVVSPRAKVKLVLKR